MRFEQKFLLLSSVVVLAAACAKNLSQILFHNSVETRAKESLALSPPAPAGVGASFSFAVFGDPQIRGENVTRLPQFKADATARGVSFFVVLGDLTEDANTDEFAKIKAALDGVGIPYYATIGNHDLFQSGSSGGWDTWKTSFGPATYSVTIGGVVRLILMDTASGEIGGTQFSWLEDQLKISVPFTLVGSHYSIYDGITPLIWRIESPEERYKLLSLLHRYHVYAYVGGHLHGFKHATVAGVEHFIIGSMYPYDLDYGTPGYVLFTYSGGTLGWQWVGL